MKPLRAAEAALDAVYHVAQEKGTDKTPLHDLADDRYPVLFRGAFHGEHHFHVVPVL